MVRPRTARVERFAPEAPYRMARSPETKAKLNRLAGRGIASLIGAVGRTSRIVYEPADLLPRLEAMHPVIVATWHGQFMMTSGFWPSKRVKVAAMVARHGDAELIGAAMSHLGVELIRGAGAGARRKDRGGVHALRHLNASDEPLKGRGFAWAGIVLGALSVVAFVIAVALIRR